MVDLIPRSLIQTLTRRLGGPLGSHAGRISRTWVYGLATLSWLFTMVRQIPCVKGTDDRYGWMCYSDITSLYWDRNLGTGAIPYISARWEYPVLTGYFVTFANWLSSLFGAHRIPDATPDQLSTTAHIFFAVNAVLLFLCLIWLVTSMMRLAPQTPQLAMIVAIAPAIWTTGLINWDLLVVALTMAGMVSWKEDRPAMAGVWWGLAVAAKFYPLVIIGALFVVCVRTDAFYPVVKLRAWGTMVGVAALTWIGVNLPMMFTHFTGWEYFYVFNSESRGADLGSLWYALSLSGDNVASPSVWSRIVIIAGYVVVAVVIYIAKRPPNPFQIAYLAVAVMLVGNLVYSPQYVLWILPLIVLARPKAVDLWVFTLSELWYFIFIWLFLRGNNLTLGISSAQWVYIFAIYIRIAATMFVMARVIRDMLSPKPAMYESVALR